MSTFEGLYLRHYMGQTPGQTGPAWTQSPDIWPNNTAPYDPTQLVTAGGYATEPPTAETQSTANYVYVRGINTATQNITSRIWLYYAQSNVVLWPQSWGSQLIYLTDDPNTPRNYTEVTAAPNQIVATDPGFLWTPQPFTGGDHYCLVAFSETPPSNPPVSPAPTTSFGTWDELAQFVITTPNMAWRNTSPVSAAVPLWQLTAPIAGAEGGGQFSIGFQCTNMPTDSFLQFTVQGPDADDTISYPKTQITKPNMGVMFSVVWPPNYNSTAIINWWRGNTDPPSGSSIQPTVAYPTSTAMTMFPSLYAGENARRIRRPHKFFGYASPAMATGTVQYYHILGSIPFQVP